MTQTQLPAASSRVVALPQRIEAHELGDAARLRRRSGSRLVLVVTVPRQDCSAAAPPAGRLSRAKRAYDGTRAQLCSAAQRAGKCAKLFCK
jgi:hypothetical protein